MNLWIHAGAMPQPDFHLIGENDLSFPAAVSARADGLVAVGGDLSPERLLRAYQRGIFPWTVNPVTWWSPNPRGVLPLEEFHISASLEKFLRHCPFEVTTNTSFREVITACAAPGPNRRGVWISPEFIAAYTRLHELGRAHSVECWQDGKLVGGIYGVSVGGLFAGESMFHRADNASKVALVKLVQHLRERNFSLFDIQMVTPATRPFGAKEISRAEYLARLAQAVELKCTF
jgi:leucyl/phenylalanyl-tRNA--protein transferase